MSRHRGPTLNRSASRSADEGEKYDEDDKLRERGRRIVECDDKMHDEFLCGDVMATVVTGLFIGMCAVLYLSAFDALEIRALDLPVEKQDTNQSQAALCPDEEMWQSLDLNSDKNKIRAFSMVIANCVILAFSFCACRTGVLMVRFIYYSVLEFNERYFRTASQQSEIKDRWFRDRGGQKSDTDQAIRESDYIIKRYTSLLSAFAVDHADMNAFSSTEIAGVNDETAQRIAYAVLAFCLPFCKFVFSIASQPSDCYTTGRKGPVDIGILSLQTFGLIFPFAVIVVNMALLTKEHDFELEKALRQEDKKAKDTFDMKLVLQFYDEEVDEWEEAQGVSHREHREGASAFSKTHKKSTSGVLANFIGGRPTLQPIIVVRKEFRKRIEQYAERMQKAKESKQPFTEKAPVVPRMASGPLLVSTSRMTTLLFILLLLHTSMGVMSVYLTIKDIQWYTPDAVFIVMFAVCFAIVENMVVNILLVQVLLINVVSLFVRYSLKHAEIELEIGGKLGELSDLRVFWQMSEMEDVSEDVKKKIVNHYVKLMSLFEEYDDNNDNMMQYEEFRRLLKSPDLNLGLREQEITILFHLADQDANGSISVPAFLDRFQLRDKQKITQLLQVFDDNNDDMLEYDEFSKMLNAPKLNLILDNTQLKELFKLADEDSTGSISVPTFLERYEAHAEDSEDEEDPTDPDSAAAIKKKKADDLEKAKTPWFVRKLEETFDPLSVIRKRKGLSEANFIQLSSIAHNGLTNAVATILGLFWFIILFIAMIVALTFLKPFASFDNYTFSLFLVLIGVCLLAVTVVLAIMQLTQAIDAGIAIPLAKSGENNLETKAEEDDEPDIAYLTDVLSIAKVMSADKHQADIDKLKVALVNMPQSEHFAMLQQQKSLLANALKTNDFREMAALAIMQYAQHPPVDSEKIVIAIERGEQSWSKLEKDFNLALDEANKLGFVGVDDMKAAVGCMQDLEDNKAKANLLHNCNLLLTQQAVSTLSPSLAKTYVVVPLNRVSDSSPVRLNEPTIVEMLDEHGMSVDRCKLSTVKLTDEQLEADLGMNKNSVALARSCQNNSLEAIQPNDVLIMMDQLGYDTGSLKTMIGQASKLTVDDVSQAVDDAVEDAAADGTAQVSQLNTKNKQMLNKTKSMLKRVDDNKFKEDDDKKVIWGPFFGKQDKEVVDAIWLGQMEEVKDSQKLVPLASVTECRRMQVLHVIVEAGALFPCWWFGDGDGIFFVCCIMAILFSLLFSVKIMISMMLQRAFVVYSVLLTVTIITQFIGINILLAQNYGPLKMKDSYTGQSHNINASDTFFNFTFSPEGAVASGNNLGLARDGDGDPFMCTSAAACNCVTLMLYVMIAMQCVLLFGRAYLAYKSWSCRVDSIITIKLFYTSKEKKKREETRRKLQEEADAPLVPTKHRAKQDIQELAKVETEQSAEASADASLKILMAS